MEKRLKLWVVMFGLLSAMTAFAGWESEKIERELEANAGDFLQVRNTNGGIEVVGWAQNYIELVAVKEAKSGRGYSAREKLDHIEVRIEKVSNGWEVATKYDRDWMRSQKMNNTRVNYRLKVPQELVMDLETTNGQVEVTDFAGSLKLESTNGDLVGREIRGHFEARTTNGSVRVELLEYDGQALSCKTTNGNVDLSLPADANAELSARTTNGSIKTDLPMKVSGSFSRNKLNGSLNGGGPEIDLRTTNGSIRISESRY